MKKKKTVFFKRNKILLGGVFLFVICNVALYFWMSTFHSLLPFAQSEYRNNAHHYKEDPRNRGGNFSLISALGQYDSQWYLKIAAEGYPKRPQKQSLNDRVMGSLTYNFFPLFPLIIATGNQVVHNVEVSAFFVSITLLVAIFFSLFYVVSKWFSPKIALKTSLLLFLFPFSIFFHGYYTEALRLLLFIWFCFGLEQQRFLLSAITCGLLCITSGISLFLLPFFILVLYVFYKDHSLPLKNALLYGLIATIPLLIWMAYCFFQTGNPFYFITTRFAWPRSEFPLWNTLQLFFMFPNLPVRSIYDSQLDVLCIALALILAFLSRKVLPPLVWLATCVLAFTPLVVQDTVSFARFSTVLFPFFVYGGYRLKKQYFFFALLLSLAGLMVVSLLFINWYWVE